VVDFRDARRVGRSAARRARDDLRGRAARADDLLVARDGQPGVVTDLGSTLDLMATFAALTGTSPPDDRKLDSYDLSPVLLLFILVDDQSPFDLKVYDPKSPLETPNIDRLAAEGMVFDGAYHMGSFSGAVCSPSRHMIMSGRTCGTCPTRRARCKKGTLPAGPGTEHDSRRLQPRRLRTMRTCKMGNSYEAANKLFTVRHDATKRGGTTRPAARGTPSRCWTISRARGANRTPLRS
jgi:choline-sulfatase